ncbi:TetR/AcrR family transcriptional regulator [Streptomyces sp. RFCAC02]|uniref:TetR/AcrR family transcriptional regulator n=1 Tax=Streptomyces sp. RFCAC02 TaxID=2499143 RepID=UPI00143CFD79|nr:TetR/AcrR family transcriptional regulator [Streptomyces sp. RFCAC02]
MAPPRDATEPRTRVPNQWGQGGRLREEILQAASRLIEAGAGTEDDLSLRAIARETGVAAPSIYRHFADRTQIVREVVAGAWAALAAELDAAGRGVPDGDSRGRLGAMAGAYGRFAARRPRHYRLMLLFERGRSSKELPPGHPARHVFDTWRDAAARFLADHLDRPQDPDTLAHLLWTGLHGQIGLRPVLPPPADGGGAEDARTALIDALLGPLPD